jgi:hypothetical protein
MKNGKIGIATDNPEVEMHIKDCNDSGSNVSLRLQSSSTNNDAIIEFYENSVEAMSIHYDGGTNDLYLIDLTQPTHLKRVTFERSGKVGIGTTTPSAKLDIYAETGEDPLRLRINGTTKVRVHDNGSVSIGTDNQGPTDGLLSNGNIVPRTHKGADLGTDGNAWDDIYYDDLHNQGASAFVDREPFKEIINYPPQGKTKGDFDYKTDKGAIELDPESMPPGLADDNSLLTDEISTYNYKTNYEQQLIINKQEKEIKQQRLLIQDLLKRINALENKINKK